MIGENVVEEGRVGFFITFYLEVAAFVDTGYFETLPTLYCQLLLRISKLSDLKWENFRRHLW